MSTSLPMFSMKASFRSASVMQEQAHAPDARNQADAPPFDDYLSKQPAGSAPSGSTTSVAETSPKTEARAQAEPEAQAQEKQGNEISERTAAKGHRRKAKAASSMPRKPGDGAGASRVSLQAAQTDSPEEIEALTVSLMKETVGPEPSPKPDAIRPEGDGEDAEDAKDAKDAKDAEPDGLKPKAEAAGEKGALPREAADTPVQQVSFAFLNGALRQPGAMPVRTHFSTETERPLRSFTDEAVPVDADPDAVSSMPDELVTGTPKGGDRSALHPDAFLAGAGEGRGRRLEASTGNGRLADVLRDVKLQVEDAGQSRHFAPPRTVDAAAVATAAVDDTGAIEVNAGRIRDAILQGLSDLTGAHGQTGHAVTVNRHLHIQLKPEHLGTVSARLTLQQGVLEIRITLPDSAWAERVRRDAEDLARRIITREGHAGGMRQVQVHIGVDPALAVVSRQDAQMPAPGQSSSHHPGTETSAGQGQGAFNGQGQDERSRAGSSSGHGDTGRGDEGIATQTERDPRAVYL